jgi:hypothetical protein
MFTTNKLQFRARPAASLMAAAGLLASVSSAQAVLLVDPTSGISNITASSTVGPSNKDEAHYQAMWAPLGSFFGSSLSMSPPTISLNGSLHYGGAGIDDSVVTQLGTHSFNRIAPMWMDLQIGASGRISETIADGWEYYAVTWENMESATTPGNYSTFQAIFFESAITLHGIAFSAGDIAFAYGALGAHLVSVEGYNVGIETTGAFSTHPDAVPTSGWGLTGMTTFPVDAGEYIHFRPNGTGNYTTTIEAIPEPGSAALGLIGASLLLRRRRA